MWDICQHLPPAKLTGATVCRYEAGEKAIAGSPIPFPALFAIQLFAMNFVEVKRWMDFKEPGSQGEEGSFIGFEGMLGGTDAVGYPGGAFNPMGMGKDNMAEMQTKVSIPLAFPACPLHCQHSSCAPRLATALEPPVLSCSGRLLPCPFSLLRCRTNTSHKLLF